MLLIPVLRQRQEEPDQPGLCRETLSQNEKPKEEAAQWLLRSGQAKQDTPRNGINRMLRGQ